MLETIQVIWFLSLLVITAYHLLVFRIKNEQLSQKQIQDFPGVSILIAVRNGTSQIRQNLHDIIQQDYPVFEIIIVDDNSDPDERKLLKEFVQSTPGVKLLTSDGAGKKNAILTGMKNAQYDFVLCTDADCRPMSKDWIKTMIEYYNDKDIILGYSPYEKSPGLLNLLVRFETVMTGMQYLSWGMKGKPYMGVGRNIGYPRKVFLDSNPFHQHQEIPYGDDDLGLQELLGKAKVKVCMDPKAHVISGPATSWSQWTKQKHRHLSAGHYYKPGLWWQPGLFGIALIIHWLLLFFIFEKFSWLIPLFAVCLLIRWFNYYSWTQRLGEKDTVWWYPFLEIIYTTYLAMMGVVTIIAKKKTWS